ncbi:MAG: hypothetical protein WKI50_03055 [Aquificaceae bacterium]
MELKTTRARHIKPSEDFSSHLNSAMEKQQEHVNKESLPAKVWYP